MMNFGALFVKKLPVLCEKFYKNCVFFVLSVSGELLMRN